MKIKLITLAAALGLATAALAGSEPAPGMSKEEYKAAKAAIEAKREADDKLCKRVQGHARDLCEAQAKGHEKAELAKLEARYAPSPEATQDAKFAVAEANYGVAKVKCELRKGKARSRCIDEAKAAREAAERQARVEKVDSTGGIFGRDDERKPARANKS